MLMITEQRLASLVLSVSLLAVSAFLWRSSHLSPNDITHDVPLPEVLHQETLLQYKEVVQVTEGVYLARGFSLGSSIMLEGPDGVVIVDTTESVDSAAEILTRFRNITAKPIKAIIITHFHGDHTAGLEAFIEDHDHPPTVITHHLLPIKSQETASIVWKLHHGATHQFGIALDSHAKAGFGALLKMKQGRTVLPPFLPSTTVHVNGDYNEMKFGGLKLVLVHVPSETPDHLAVWLPDKRVVVTGDAFYRSFPNLYAIRGTAPRNILVWAESIQKIMDLKPLHVVPSHTTPLSGEETEETLKIYRDAILYVHDQTVRHLNKAMHPDAIAHIVQLPPQLRNNPYLSEVYGAVEWSVKAVFNQYIGWFSGDPVELHPLTPKDKAERMVELLGVSSILQAAREALQARDYQWALELSSYVFKARPDDVDALSLRLESLRMLASKETSSNGRHYYLTAALADHKLIDWTLDLSVVIKRSPLRNVLSKLNLRFKAEDAVGVTTTAAFSFTDTGEVFVYHVENCVMHVKEMDHIPEEVDVSLTTTSVIFRKILLKEVTSFMAYLTGDIVIKGGLWKFRQFMSYIEDDVSFE